MFSYLINMTKPNEKFTVVMMKKYIRTNKLNHPDVKLGMKRADMIAGLQKIGHWDYRSQKGQTNVNNKIKEVKKAQKKLQDKRKEIARTRANIKRLESKLK